MNTNVLLTRRHFFGRTATGIGTAALASLLNPELFAATAGDAARERWPRTARCRRCTLRRRPSG